jgi:hypothetical protein
LLITVRQGRQRCYAAAAEEGNSVDAQWERKIFPVYLHSGNLALAAMYLRRVRVAVRTFAAALMHFPLAVALLAPVEISA